MLQTEYQTHSLSHGRGKWWCSSILSCNGQYITPSTALVYDSHRKMYISSHIVHDGDTYRLMYKDGQIGYVLLKHETNGLWISMVKNCNGRYVGVGRALYQQVLYYKFCYERDTGIYCPIYLNSVTGSCVFHYKMGALPVDKKYEYLMQQDLYSKGYCKISGIPMKITHQRPLLLWYHEIQKNIKI